MPSVTKSIKLDRPPAEALALATDPARFEEWLSLHAAWPNGVPESVEQGDAFTQKLSIMGMPADVNWTVEEKTDEKVVMRGGGPMGAQLATTIMAVPDGEAAMVSYEAEFSGGGIQGPMGDMVTKKAGEEIATSLEKLRELAAV
jgi:acetyl-CoA C-acetyltransferase